MSTLDEQVFSPQPSHLINNKLHPAARARNSCFVCFLQAPQPIFTMFSLSLSFNNVTTMYLGENLSVYPTWGLLSFLDLESNIFHQIWDTVGHYFLKCFSVPSSLHPSPGAPTAPTLVHVMSHGLRGCFNSILFYTCSTDLLISIDPSLSLLILSSAIPNHCVAH